MKKLTRRDFLRNLKDLGIGVGLLPLARKISELPVETKDVIDVTFTQEEFTKIVSQKAEVIDEAVVELLRSPYSFASAGSGDEVAALVRGDAIEIKRATR